jgi:DNA-binding MarR family transcriptional regulator
MSSKRLAGAPDRPQGGPADHASPRLTAVPDDPGSGPAEGAFEAPFKWGMIYLIARIFYEVKDRTEAALGPFELTSMQFTILASVGRWNGLSSAELSRRFGVTPQTMGEMIANLQRRDLVVRRRDPSDARTLKVDLTDEGHRLVEACNAQMRKTEMAMMKDLSPAEVQDLRAGLVALHEQLGLTVE